ncbi:MULTISPECIES: hypothetical protein [unclassified Phaeobacter]|uniref:hypothetical protein n=1 Tax=unclassified Phaeobacter TaxID=2621772 RepID=UPI003A89311E
MRLTETIPSQPIEVQKSVRPDRVRALTSGHAGKILPLAYVPMFREDRVSRGQYRVRLEMMETAEMLMNAVNVTVHAHFIPFLAFDRFNGMDALNRSYKGIPETEGGDPIPFFEEEDWKTDSEIYQTMGLHQGVGGGRTGKVNTMIVESYNVLVNYMRKARSSSLPTRDKLDHTLAAAFWKHTNSNFIVPDFDQASIDGEVPINIVQQRLPVTGIGITHAVNPDHYGSGVRQTDGASQDNVWWQSTNAGVAIQTDHSFGSDVSQSLPLIYAELGSEGVSLSLSNIELAKKTAAFAKLRQKYDGLDDEHIIDLLMDGIRVPEQALSQPILLDKKQTIMGYSRRYATDGDNLAKSATNGETYVDIRFRTPPMNTGGIILITAQIVPEQLWERQKDHFLNMKAIGRIPDFTRDFLDPEKVAIVTKSHFDVEHSDPGGTFGYAPLNYQWRRDLSRIGGKYYRPTVDQSFDENRQKIWAIETVDPELNEDFYLTNDLHHNVFADQVNDPFEITTIGGSDIVGNTVFGKGLHEAVGDYDALISEADISRIDKTKTKAENDVTD